MSQIIPPDFLPRRHRSHGNIPRHRPISVLLRRPGALQPMHLRRYACPGVEIVCADDQCIQNTFGKENHRAGFFAVVEVDLKDAAVEDT